MKKAVGTSWQCPVCKKFIGKFSATTGKCQFCGENLDFSIEKEGPIEAGKTLPLTPGEVFNKYGSYVETQCSYQFSIKSFPTVLVQGGKFPEVERLVVVDFENKPIMLRFLKKYSESTKFSLSEVILGFLGKGVKQYIVKQKEEKESQ